MHFAKYSLKTSENPLYANQADGEGGALCGSRSACSLINARAFDSDVATFTLEERRVSELIAAGVSIYSATSRARQMGPALPQAFGAKPEMAFGCLRKDGATQTVEQSKKDRSDIPRDATGPFPFIHAGLTVTVPGPMMLELWCQGCCVGAAVLGLLCPGCEWHEVFRAEQREITGGRTLILPFPTAPKYCGISKAVCLTENESESRWLVGPDQRPAPHCRAENRYTLLDCCWVLCALLVFFSDGATDLWLAADYYLRGDFWWFGLTLVFVVVPSAVVQVLSFRWFVYDYSEMNDSSREEAAARGGGGDSNFSTKGSGQRGSGSAVGVRPLPAQSSRGRTLRCCRVCMWVFQTVIHILQLGQVWRGALAPYECRGVCCVYMCLSFSAFFPSAPPTESIRAKFINQINNISQVCLSQDTLFCWCAAFPVFT
ncbi:hypothetical protein P4O66_004568 [Electrophorus voltai]|uniref:XK-related protein n=1 Tax=Electrophorus voltai TaxID=2609070 RepID=A0AAD8ZLF6_9TELE|nr:hypothetical protein P4O66_004568 [Electrophorus voltai]